MNDTDLRLEKNCNFLSTENVAIFEDAIRWP